MVKSLKCTEYSKFELEYVDTTHNMTEQWHAWYSAKAEAAMRDAETKSEIPVYFDEHNAPVETTFVSKERQLDFYSEWDDLEYKGVVTRWNRK